MRAILTIAGYVLLEARRTGIPWLWGCTGVLGIVVAGFLSQLALTDGAGIQTSVLGALFRLCGVFLVTAFVISSMVRESNDKGLELLLSMPISRTQYFLGKLGGFIAFGFFVSGGYFLLMLAWGTPTSVAAWSISLAFELALMVATGLFFVLTLTQVVPALAASGGLYLLGRSIAAMQAISSGPLIGDESMARRLAAFSVDAVALILPPLDRATQSAWLVYAPPSAGEMASVIAALSLYCALLSAAGLFDLHRRNL